MWHGNIIIYNRDLFYMRHHGFTSGSTAGDGILCSSDDFIGGRNGWNQNCVDLRIIPKAQIPLIFVYFLSGILDAYHCAAVDMPVFRAQKGARTFEGKCLNLYIGSNAHNSTHYIYVYRKHF